MDETSAAPATTTASASAAAVAADGATSASAAVNLKNSAATNTNTTSTSGTSVKLLIKASNQQYDDQIIESDLLWTVRRLKTHLSTVYPSKPPVAEQKLIYSGQLLNDLMQLKDVIRSYKDVYTHNHIIHLVYIPKSMTTAKPTVKTPATTADTQRNNMSSSADTTDGLRQRHVSGANSQRSDIFNTQQQQYQRQFLQFAQNNGLLSAAAATMQPVANAHMSPMQAAAYLQQMQHTTPPQIALTTAATCMPPTTEFNALAANAIAAQQMAMYNAWMQQVYAQYLQQITGLNSTATAAGQSDSGEQLAAMQAYLQQQMPYMTYPNATTVIPTPNMMTAFPNLLGVNHAAHMPTATTAVNEEQQQQQQQQEQPQQPQQEVQQRRFPNIVQDEAENRDWLDSFFSITRLAIFLTVLYFNTSPLRCFIVLIIGGAIYLYHIGVLRLRTERNNNNINRNNNAAEQIRQGVQQVQAAQQEQQQQQQEQLAAAAPAAAVAAGDAVDGAGGVAAAAGDAVTDPLVPTSSDNNSDTPNEAAAVEDNASMISFIRTFVITFFTSLLPETPAL